MVDSGNIQIIVSRSLCHPVRGGILTLIKCLTVETLKLDNFKTVNTVYKDKCEYDDRIFYVFSNINANL